MSPGRSRGMGMETRPVVAGAAPRVCPAAGAPLSARSIVRAGGAISRWKNWIGSSARAVPVVLAVARQAMASRTGVARRNAVALSSRRSGARDGAKQQNAAFFKCGNLQPLR